MSGRMVEASLEALNPPASLRTFADAQVGFAQGGCACAGNLEDLLETQLEDLWGTGPAFWTQRKIHPRAKERSKPRASKDPLAHRKGEAPRSSEQKGLIE